MVENLTSLGVTPNEVDSDVGEDGEEDEDEKRCHGNGQLFPREIDNHVMLGVRICIGPIAFFCFYSKPGFLKQ